MAEQLHLAILPRGRGSVEITDDIAALVRDSTYRQGLVNIFVRHTSCGLAITENANPSARRDLETLVDPG